jgi:hypothetical protein
MDAFQNTVTIARPAADVFGFLTDFSNVPVNVQRLGPTEPALVSRARKNTRPSSPDQDPLGPDHCEAIMPWQVGGNCRDAGMNRPPDRL